MLKRNEREILSVNPQDGNGFSWFRSSPEGPEALEGVVKGARELSDAAQQIIGESGSLVNLFHGVRVSHLDLVDVERLRRACAVVLADLISCRQCLDGRSRAATAAAKRAVRKAS